MANISACVHLGGATRGALTGMWGSAVSADKGLRSSNSPVGVKKMSSGCFWGAWGRHHIVLLHCDGHAPASISTTAPVGEAAVPSAEEGMQGPNLY